MAPLPLLKEKGTVMIYSGLGDGAGKFGFWSARRSAAWSPTRCPRGAAPGEGAGERAAATLSG